jgi:phospho-N-acetylmuramoyl-pentapeptide-transferase
MREGIFIPFVILFGLFIVELLSSFTQIIFKKVYHKKLFAIAPFHHLCEYYGMKEYTVVMKFRMIQ